MEANLVRNSIDVYEQELELEQAVEKRLKIQTSYQPNEMRKRIKQSGHKIWYVPMLAYYYKTPDFDTIRGIKLLDAMTSLEHIIKST